ncbi:MAG: DMT family transporter [Gemmatimonadales bacterium]|nr:DMT family transporter [Gemmatimonadales bacterium]
MDSARRNANLVLMLAAAIWGFAFVAQRVGMRHLGPLTFNGIRFGLGALALTPLLIYNLRKQRIVGDLNENSATGKAPNKQPSRAFCLRAGLLTGLLIFGGSTFQQFGVVYTTAGKAGFITSLYVVFVPILGLLTGQGTGRWTWWGALLAAIGLYLLSIRGWMSIDLGDGLVLIGALFWASHVLAVGKLSGRIDPIRLAVSQFIVCSLLSLLGALIFESFQWPAIRAAAVPILYAGILSVGVAYTLQLVGQRHAQPAHAAIILSFEAVYAVIGGWLILNEGLTPRAMIGCALMLAGVFLAQRESGPRDSAV